MSENSIVKKTARIVVVEAVPARRMLLADIMRGFGFPAVATVNKPSDLLSHLKASPVDWIIMPLSSEHTVNGLHILKIITSYPSLHKVRVSMLFTMEERIHIPMAFELGLLSCHLSPYNRESMTRSFEQLFERFASNTLDMTLVSAEYLRQTLVELRMAKLRLNLETALSEIYTADTKILMNLAKAQSATGQPEDAISTLNHAELISKNAKIEIDQLRRDFVARSQEMGAPAPEFEAAPPPEGGPQIDIDTSAVRAQLPKTNLLGLKSVVIIDPDSKTQYLAETLLKDAGITNIAIYSDGAEAWEAMKDQPEPDLVLMEWVLTGIAGPLLLQRLRQKGFLYVPIVVASSHVKADDMPLVAEMGVSAVIDKPLDQRTFFKSIVTVLQQTRRPHEQVSLETKIRSLLESGNIPEAERLWMPYRSDARIPPSAQWQLEAEFLYHYGRYEEACEQASNALQEFPNSLALLNLLGKCLLKLGRYKVALKCFSRAQNISPNNVERLCRIAETKHFMNDAAGSESTLAKADALDPGNSLVQETKANIALDSGEVRKASELMAKLESLRGVLAFMNNRAIALTRAGRFDDGIALYRNTIVALPGDWGNLHDSVAYNLGLAHARYGELDKAIDSLHKIRAPSPTLKQKSQSLLSRLKTAKEQGGALVLQEADNKLKDIPISASGDMIAKVEVKRGDICCYLLFHADEGAGPATHLLLAQMPVFQKKVEADEDKIAAAIKPNKDSKKKPR